MKHARSVRQVGQILGPSVQITLAHKDPLPAGIQAGGKFGVCGQLDPNVFGARCRMADRQIQDPGSQRVTGIWEDRGNQARPILP